MMKKLHHVTNITAFVLLFAVIAISGMATVANKIAFADPMARLTLISGQSTNSSALPTIPSESELAQNLTLVFNVGKEIGNPETLQAILMQETNGGRSDLIGNKDSPVGKRSYGLMQVQVCAARSVLAKTPHLFQKYFPNRMYKDITDEEIIALLLTNKEANARIAAYHFKLYMALSKGNWDKAVASYNAGIATQIKHYDQYPYVIEVKAKMNTIIKTFNRRNGLELTERL